MIPQGDALFLQLAAIAGGEPAGGLLEVRERVTSGGMRAHFFPAGDLRGAARGILELAERAEVFLGVAPRRSGVLKNGRQSGGLDAIERCWTLHVDADTEEACAALERFSPPPAVVVRSGSGLHGYWPLRQSLPPAWAARANRRLAFALGGDLAAADAARILRPAGTENRKTTPPRPVECVYLDVVAYLAADVVGSLPDPPSERAPSLPTRPLPGRAGDEQDPLLAIPAAEYVPALIGRPVGRDGKAQCPFHAGGQERTPSLHAYPDDRGWYCWPCQAGGTIIDLGARLYGIEPRGAGYHELRRRLAGELLDALGEAA